jgi:hypothetical protein
MTDIDPIRFGEMSQQIENLQKSVDRLEVVVQELDRLISESKGGLKLLITLGAFSAAMGSLVTWAVGHIRFG